MLSLKDAQHMQNDTDSFLGKCKMYKKYFVIGTPSKGGFTLHIAHQRH